MCCRVFNTLTFIEIPLKFQSLLNNSYNFALSEQIRSLPASLLPAALLKWTSSYTKLLISIRKENENLFNSGRLRKKAIWSRIADKFNDVVDGVYTTGEQCQSKWKKLEQKYKEVKLHNNKSGNNRKEWEFYDLMDDVIGTDPKIIPVCTMSSMGDSQHENDAIDDMEANSENEQEDQEGKRKKKRRKSTSTSTAVVEFLNEYAMENKEKDREKMDMLQRMHDDKMDVMNRFLTIMERQYRA